MKRSATTLFIILATLCFLLELEAKTFDPYKVLGVDKTASQREIQKAFHKLSLQYHPDKNKAKGAQEKFSQINNAYEILSDEEKRKNYDLYGDEKGNPGFQTGYPGGRVVLDIVALTSDPGSSGVAVIKEVIKEALSHFRFPLAAVIQILLDLVWMIFLEAFLVAIHLGLNLGPVLGIHLGLNLVPRVPPKVLKP